MKVCAACSQALSKEKFSKKQWQSKQHRRCKECIAVNREVLLLEAPNDDEPPPMQCADGEEFTPSWTDEDLFKQPSPRQECPICCLPLPWEVPQISYQACCGKTVCMGCMRGVYTGDNRCLCPYCRAPAANSTGEYIKRLKKRVEADDASAVRNLASRYANGEFGLPQDIGKAIEFWIRAGELGCSRAYTNIGYVYDCGEGVERDKKKAKHYYELAAMRGDVIARHNLGIIEESEGNMNRATKHYMIAAGAGEDNSLRKIREYFMKGHATKDDFEKALRAHNDAKDEVKSDQRDAAATDEQFLRNCV